MNENQIHPEDDRLPADVRKSVGRHGNAFSAESEPPIEAPRAAAELKVDAIPPDLQAFEEELAGLRPRSDCVDRERIAFLAGRASVNEARHVLFTSRWGWPIAFAGMTALAASFAIMLLDRPVSPVVERVVYLPQPSARGSQQPGPSATNERSTTKPAQAPAESVAARESRTGVWIASRFETATPIREVRFRYFDHLLDARIALGGSDRGAVEATEADAPVWSVRSFPDLLNDSSQEFSSSESSFPRNVTRSGANS